MSRRCIGAGHKCFSNTVTHVDPRLLDKLGASECEGREDKDDSGLRRVTKNRAYIHLFRIQARKKHGEDWNEHGLVFPTNTGRIRDPRNVIAMFKRILKKAGLPESIRLHDLRHTAAPLMIGEGIHPRVVMEILGHSKINVTMGTYRHVSSGMQREATEMIATLFRKEADEEAEE